MVRRDPSVDDPGKPVRRGRRWALAAGAALVAVLAAVWAERRPIAVHLIDRTLAAHGVPARYRVESIGLGRQRLTGLVIGDPVHPDLVADWIETETGVGLHGPTLTGLRAGRVRAWARVVDGRLSFGAIDRLLPAGGGEAGLPALTLDLADARLRVDTPVGTVGVGLAGRGRLDGGFEGRAALVGGPVAASGCVAAPPRAALRVWTSAGRVGLAGPITTASATCGATRWRAPTVVIDASLDPATSTWGGRWQLKGGAIDGARIGAGSIVGAGTVDGVRGLMKGRLSLTARDVVAATATAAGIAVTGTYSVGEQPRFDGEVTVTHAAVPFALGHRAAALSGTPIGPLAVRAATALDAAARSIGGTARIAVVERNGSIGVTIADAALSSPTGALARFAGSATAAGAIDGRLSLSGGGLPAVTATLRRESATMPIVGAATMRPYRQDGAMLAATPLIFSVAPSGEARLATVATLSGPLGAGGAVDRLTVPLTLRRGAGGAMWINEGCVTTTLGALATGGLRLEAARIGLCPVDGALVRIAANGTVGGGARTGPLRLAGRLGTGPVAIAAGGATVSLATRGFAATGVAATLGEGDRPTRLAAGSLTGSFAGGGVAGAFADAGGRIGAVPLLLSHAAGTWRVAGGALDLAGALTVTDADAADPACTRGAANPPRFCPMRAQGVALRLADGRIAATGMLAEPITGARVAGVTIAHDLASGTGHADLAVDGLAFAKGGLQPDKLTPVTEGVIADVAGTIEGAGRIAWGDAGVTSTGRFTTAGTDLAADFGTVKGVAGSIEFTDLLGLVSAPGQRLTVASINAGVLVENGSVRFHTESGPQVAVEDAHWPFAGGTLTLEPTLLDFSAPAERHMTFRLDGIAADRFLQQFDYKNLVATGVFDGVLPMVFDAKGGRIEGGRLTVREGGGSLAYVGDLSQKELGVWGNLAFQALKSLRYRNLSILMGGPLDGEIVTEVRFAGISQGQGAKSNFLIRRLQRLPFVFNVKIKAPFRTLLDGLDPERQVQLHMRELIDSAKRPGGSPAPVQPSASEAVP